MMINKNSIFRILGQHGVPITITLVICGVGLIIFSLALVTKTSIDKGEIHSSELVKDSISIYRNKFSIPHIIAKNEHDAFIAMGYVHAQDRLWQMDIARRAGRGRLAEIFGDKALASDKFMRAMNLVDIANRLYSHSSKTTKQILDAYSAGINLFLTSNPDKLPFEFGALSYSPDPWTPADCFIIMRLMAIEMNMSMWTDLAFGKIADKIGIASAMSLLPQQTPGTIYQYESNIEETVENTEPLAATYLHGFSNIATNTLYEGRTYLGFSGDGIGSNAWVMRTSPKGKSTSVILANDPHLRLSLPARWYQAHISCPGFNALGATIPGLPLIVSGRNDNSTWGITNMMNDDFDYFIEKVDRTNTNYYFDEDGNRKKFFYKRDTIIIKGGEPIIYDIRFTKRSAVISDAPPTGMVKNATFIKSKFDDYCLTYSWTGMNMSDEILGVYKVMKSKTWADCKKGFDLWCAPALNFVYGNAEGTIASATIGMMPKRGEKNNPNLPSPGWKKGYAWTGIYTTSILPSHSYAPNDNSRRYIVTANNPLQARPSIYHSALWESSSRADRLHQALKEFDEYDVRDAQFLQMDVYSAYAKQIKDSILPVLLAKRKYLEPQAKKAVDKLKNWKCFITNQDVEPTIYTLFLEEYHRSIFEDQLTKPFLALYNIITNVPTRILLHTLYDDESKWANWMDDVRTKNKIEHRSEIIFRAFVRAMKRGDSIFSNGDIRTWKYGQLHSLTLEHLFSANSLLSPIVTHGPFPHGGNNTTLNNGSWSFNEPFKQTLGASVRIISDMRDTSVYCVLPGGVSGEPLSSHYSDQVQLWLNGGYITLSSTSSVQSDFSLFSTLLPKSKDE
ncbi:penicillin acylase family protein [bacterium]|nr:penicillin acylase family protein [bacterium]